MSTDNLLDYWPAASTAVAAVAAWVTASWKAGRDEEEKTIIKLEALRERAHSTELELAQIRAVMSAATGLKFSEITLQLIQDLVAKQHVTLKELETFILTMPRLMWIKRREGPGVFTMLQVSQAYADKYLGAGPNEYKGKKDIDIWPEEVAIAFAENDERAFISGKVIDVNEYVISPKTGTRGYFKGVKWSFVLDQHTYICGLGVHINEEHTDGKKK